MRSLLSCGRNGTRIHSQSIVSVFSQNLCFDWDFLQATNCAFLQPQQKSCRWQLSSEVPSSVDTFRATIEQPTKVYTAFLRGLVGRILVRWPLDLPNLLLRPCTFLCFRLITSKFPAWGKMLWAFRVSRPLSMGFFLMERIFYPTTNRVLMACTEWLPGVQLSHSVEDYGGWWSSGCCGSVACRALVAQVRGVLGSTPSDCQLFHFPLILPHSI